MDIHGYSAHILVNGRKVKEYRHNGLTFIEAKDGTEFAIEVKNHLGSRILAVTSVDGLDIIEGKPATKDSGGYIIGPNHAETFSGWRKSDEEVGAFKFTTSDKSYATEKGKGQNNGIIAIKLFSEKAKQYISRGLPWTQNPFPQLPSLPHYPTFPNNPNYPEPYSVNITGQMRLGGTDASYSSKGTSSCLRSLSPQVTSSVSFMAMAENETTADMAAFDMGTTWGSKKEEKVVTSSFDRADELTTFEFYYASREALKAMGIPLVSQREVSLPKGFANNSYATPPKNWR